MSWDEYCRCIVYVWERKPDPNRVSCINLLYIYGTNKLVCFCLFIDSHSASSASLKKKKSPYSVSPSPRHHRCCLSFLHPSQPHRLLPQFAQRLPVLFPNPAPSGCLAAAGRYRCPCRWWLGARVGAPQVILGRAKGTHERGQCWWCSRAFRSPSAPP